MPNSQLKLGMCNTELLPFYSTGTALLTVFPMRINHQAVLLVQLKTLIIIFDSLGRKQLAAGLQSVCPLAHLGKKEMTQLTFVNTPMTILANLQTVFTSGRVLI